MSKLPMKKKYITPRCEVVPIAMPAILAGSGTTGDLTTPISDEDAWEEAY